jgi:hypothetical protein
MQVKYPEIEVQLSGNDGNAYSIMGAVSKALKRADVSQVEIDQYINRSTSGDYDYLLQTAASYVTIK